MFSFNENELTARMLMRLCPPWQLISFGEDGRAREDLSVLLIGYGRLGRAVLNYLLVNGQFAGSTFHADVVDQRGTEVSGWLTARAPELLKHYDIRFHEANTDGAGLFRLLAENGSRYKAIILCTGNQEKNLEILHDLKYWYQNRPNVPIMIRCTRDSMIAGKMPLCYADAYTRENLDMEKMDSVAMAINHTYMKGESAAADWLSCDAFSRASSRASADFSPAFLRAAGITMEQVEQGGWPPPENVLENLAETEHKRWCAFHCSMGYRPMTREEFRLRADLYRKEMKEKGSSSVRLNKDPESRTHICLVPWEELDGLSRKMNEVTGGRMDYKAMDRENVLALPGILEQVPEQFRG